MKEKNDLHSRKFSEKSMKEFKSNHVTEKPTVKRCECGKRIRGENHESGEHHNKVKQDHRPRR